MKKSVAICISCFVFLSSVMGQMDQSIAPKTFSLPAAQQGKVNEIVLPPFSAEELATLDYNDSKNGHMPVIARNIATDINLNNTGTWTILSNGDRVWRVEITGAGALALIPLFNQLYLPKGSYLHAYDPRKKQILGAFTNYNTPETRAFCTGLVHGESCIIEYFEPYSEKNKGIVSINRVGYAYRDVDPLPEDGMKSGSQSCEVNTVCSEGNKWRNQIRSVVRILIISDSINGDGWCSGALVNNVRKDCTPYILSAEHCIENGVTANAYNQWVFYFNYQASTCSGTTGPENFTVVGCKKLAQSDDGVDINGSDFLLLQLNHAPSTGYNVYYSGWDITPAAPTSGVCIHHPQADIKKISTYTSAAVSASWSPAAENTHWLVQWVTTANGHGISEPGSSGSPIYNQDTLIVGHLTGGSSCCTDGACSTTIPTGPNHPDFFGKLSYDWTTNGVTSATQIKPWLDPDNTGTTLLRGMNPPCGNSLTNDAGIQAISEPEGNVCATDVTPVIAMRNFGSNTLNSLTLSYSFDNGVFSTYNWSGTLFAGSTTNVTLPTSTLSPGAHTFTVISTKPNGATDANLLNDTLTSSFFISDPGGNLNLSVTTDNKGSKTTWQITDGASNVVASGGPYPNIGGGVTYNLPFCLPIACYTFTIFSSSGDGMHNGENGNFVLTADNGAITYASLTSPSFGSQEAHTFCAQLIGIRELPAFSFSIIPNPSTGQFNVVIDNSDIKKIQIYDITGRLILERKTADQNVTLDLSAESKGIYILQVETMAGKAVQKLVLK